MRKFKIRRTNNTDLMRSLHKDVFEADEFPENKDNIYWIAYEDKEPVGFCILLAMNNDIVFLSRAGVLRSARGNGIQKRFIRVRERYAKKNNYKNIITYTKISNIKSSNSLQKCGYKLYLPEWEYADKDCLYWIKGF